MSEAAIRWLLDGGNPAVCYRARTELLGETADRVGAAAWAARSLPADWPKTSGLWFVYSIAAFAECGLRHEDVPEEGLSKALAGLEAGFDCGCEGFMLLTALAKLGLAGHPAVRSALRSAEAHALPDGGFLCLHRVRKRKDTPKSCYKDNLHALLFLAECRKRGVEAGFGQPLIEYFLNRNLFYKSTDRTALVLDGREGWRTIDTFYPFEVMRVGLQNVVEAFSALGYGNDGRLREAWDLLDRRRDGEGRVFLMGTLSKSYLPREKVGGPSRWATLYALLAEKHRDERP